MGHEKTFRDRGSGLMDIFKYKVENTISESNEEFQDWLNDEGENGWELINTRVLNEKKDKRGNRETYHQCIFKRKK